MEYFKKYFDEVEGCVVREFGKNFLITENGNIIKIWEDPNDIEKELGISKNSIQKSISKCYTKTFGYKWGYKEVV